MNKTFFLINYGCPKNLVDGEGIAATLIDDGFAQTTDVDKADVVLVNTCGFIGEAEMESRAAIEHFTKHRNPGQKIVAAGCLTERRGDSLLEDYQDLDALLGTRRWNEVGELVSRLDTDHRPTYLGPAVSSREMTERAIAGTHSYVKIADGCNKNCSFCTIPSFKGRQKSLSLATILFQLKSLTQRGIKEAVLVAQELGSYGQDLRDDGLDLVGLLQEIEESPGPEWIRLMYVYPSALSRQLLQTIVHSDRICDYVDVPIQHCSPNVLKLMRRPTKSKPILRYMDDAREMSADFAFRTTIIVGFPGETQADFDELLKFVDDAEFDHLGVFRYNREDGTPAAQLPGQVSERVKQERYDQIMKVQQAVSLRRRKCSVGKEADVLIEESFSVPLRGQFFSVGRSAREAPEVDGQVLMREKLAVGAIVRSKIVAAEPYDLHAILVK